MTKLVTFAIETSCDDTSLGIVEYEDGLFTNPLLKAYSQVPDHQNYGGVVPEVAYRLHEEKILDIIKEI
jgi:N6-L-threonylcarbamoyladenine synthase